MDFKKKIEELELKEKALSFNQKVDDSIKTLPIDDKFKPFVKPGTIALISIVLVSFLFGENEEQVKKPVENNTTVLKTEKTSQQNPLVTKKIEEISRGAEVTFGEDVIVEEEETEPETTKTIVPKPKKIVTPPVKEATPDCVPNEDGNIETVCDFIGLKKATKALKNKLSIEGVSTIKMGKDLSLGNKNVVLKQPFILDCDRNTLKDGNINVRTHQGTFMNCNFSGTTIKAPTTVLITKSRGNLTIKNVETPELKQNKFQTLNIINSKLVKVESTKIREVVTTNVDSFETKESTIAFKQENNEILVNLYSTDSNIHFITDENDYKYSINAVSHDCFISNSTVTMSQDMTEYDHSKNKNFFGGKEFGIGCRNSKIMNSKVHLPLGGGIVYQSEISAFFEDTSIYNSNVLGQPIGGNYLYFSASKYDFNGDKSNMRDFEGEITSINSVPAGYKSAGGIINCSEYPELEYDYYGNERDCDAPTIGFAEAN